ncbi:benzoate 4-monooxygenase cytochrome P450 [Xylariaceae sp. FL0255]|nr:benzoate 4-monooxygenase cytochrome P450 [Xylariaceae sp. FL0255]
MTSANIIAAATGILAHRCLFIRGEWHIQSPAIVRTHLVLFIFLFPVLDVYRDLGSPISNTCVVHASAISMYLVSLFSSITVYRLLLHPLRSFPGPKLAALSTLWNVWKCRDSRRFQILESWHRQYGTVVRTGPNELTLLHPAAHDAMDGPTNRNTRSELYDLIHPLSSSIFTRDNEIHRESRKMWDRALGISAISQYKNRIIARVNMLESIVGQADGQAVHVNDLVHWYSFDSMGDIAFGQEFGMMKNREWVEAALCMRSAITLLGPFIPAIWLSKIAFTYFPGQWKVAHFMKMLEFSASCMRARKERQNDQPDIISAFLDEHKRHGNTDTRGPLLGGDAATLLVAGSDTSAASIIILLYFLARYPNHASKIREELQNIDHTDFKALTALPHLDATINEALRLIPSVPTWGSRIVAREGLSLDGIFIPGGTKICASRYSIGRLDCAYVRPNEFIPERWYSQPELIKDRRAFSPFGVGKRSCAGKRIAMVQMKLVVACLLRKYHVGFAPGHDSVVAFERDMRDQLTAIPGKLMLVFKTLS